MRVLVTSVRARLGLALVFGAVLLLLVGGLGIQALNQANGSLSSVYRQNVLPMRALSNVLGSTLDLRGRLLTPALFRSDEEMARNQSALQEYREQSDKAWQQYLTRNVDADRERALIKQVQQQRETLDDQLTQYRRMLEGNQRSQAIDFSNEALRGTFIALREELNQLIDIQSSATLSAFEAGQQSYHQQFRLIAVIVGLALVAMALAGWRLIRGIIRPLKQAQHFAENIAHGHLDAHIEHGYRDEFGRVLDALGSMRDRLAEIVRGARRNAETVGAASAQLASGNDELSRRTQEQAASLEQTAASMEEMTATVKQNADNAGQADQLAGSARDQAVAGGEVVNQAVSAMGEINESSRQISAIVSLIDDIAFQTNLLALNAAVEAARAGEQGRGFAVVAGEVRTLASRSAEAAREIKTLVKTTVARVDNGSALVTRSGETLAEIVTSVRRTTDLVSEIAMASREQSSGIDQVNTAISQMDEITQRNAAMVEEASSASRILQEQAEALLACMAFFQLTGEDGERVSAAGPVQADREAAQLLTATGRQAIRRFAAAAPARKTPEAGEPARAASRQVSVGSEDAWESF